MITDTPIYDELVEEIAYYAQTCDHGLSLWLCEDPINHYPPDDPFGSYLY